MQSIPNFFQYSSGWTIWIGSHWYLGNFVCWMVPTHRNKPTKCMTISENYRQFSLTIKYVISATSIPNSIEMSVKFYECTEHMLRNTWYTHCFFSEKFGLVTLSAVTWGLSNIRYRVVQPIRLWHISIRLLVSSNWWRINHCYRYDDCYAGRKFSITKSARRSWKSMQGIIKN